MQRVEDDNRKKPEMTSETAGAPTHQLPGLHATTSRSRSGRPATPGAPFVGLIRYGEQLIELRRPRRHAVRRPEDAQVTEIFRFQNGRWVY